MPRDGRISRNHQKAKRETAAPVEQTQQRMYAAAKAGRLDFVASTTSADGELYTSLRHLRNKSRALTRDHVYAKRAKALVINNVIGGGVGLQCKVENRDGALMKRVNAAIEREFKAWCRAENCHTGGALHFHDIERLILGEEFEAGEMLIRFIPQAFGSSRVPLALELMEAERIADDVQITGQNGNQVTNGIEHDRWFRPTAYYVREQNPAVPRNIPTYHQGEVIRIPAEQIIHLKVTDRWPQTRGVPMLHASIVRLGQLGEYENAALVAARIGASKVGFFESEWMPNTGKKDKDNPTAKVTTDVEAGEFTQLPPGYKFASWSPEYPHQLFADFTRAAIRGIAAGIGGVSFEALSGDYSQSNYSSSRLARIEERDHWRVLQQWYVRSFREPLHRMWLQMAVLSGAIPELRADAFLVDPERYAAVKWKLRGWSFIDPQKEVAAWKEAERAGYVTKSEVYAQNGNGTDLDDYIATRTTELEALAEAGIETDTTTGQADEPEQPPEPEPEDDDEQPDDDEGPPLRVLRQ